MTSYKEINDSQGHRFSFTPKIRLAIHLTIQNKTILR